MTLPDVDSQRQQAANAAFAHFLDQGDPGAIADLFDLCAASLRRTAMHLVGDAATADDLVQVTFLSALEQRTFDRERDVLPWLAGILRNQAALVHRRRARAIDRDRLCPIESADPLQGAAEREALTEIEAAIEQLPAVYQPVVMLHVLHGLEAGAISKTLGRPGGTVRTQLMRGLDKLRQLLPIGLAGAVAGLLPGVGLAAVRQQVLGVAARTGAPTAAAATVAAAWWARPRAVLLAFVTVAAAVLAVAVWWGNDEPGAPSPSVAVTSDVAPAPVPTPAADAPTAAASERQAPPVPVVAGAFALSGVVRRSDGATVAGAEVLLWTPGEQPVMRGGGYQPAPSARTITAADGSYTVRGSGESCYLVARTAAEHCDQGVYGELEGRGEVAGLDFELAPLVMLRGQLRAPDGTGIAGFALESVGFGRIQPWQRLDVDGFAQRSVPRLAVTTGEDGGFATEAVQGAYHNWHVRHVDCPELRVQHQVGDGDLVLQLQAGATATGIVRRPDGSLATGVPVTLRYPRRKAATDARGEFVFRGLEPEENTVLFTVDDPNAAICCVQGGDCRAPLEVRLEAPRQLAGRVVDGDGGPMAGAELRIIGDRLADTGFGYSEPSTWEFVFGCNERATAADGSFRFERLYDGVFQVWLREPAARDFVEVARVRSGNQDMVLDGAAVAAGRVTVAGRLRDPVTDAEVGAVKVSVMRPDGEGGQVGRVHTIEVHDGAYELAGLAAGPIELHFEVEGYAQARFDQRQLSAGRHTLDVELHPTRKLDVVVRRDGKQVAGWVSVHRGDGNNLMLSQGDGLRTARRQLIGDKIRLWELPAAVITVVVETRDGARAEQILDLTRPRTEPVYFELGQAEQRPPPLEFGLLVLRSLPGREGSEHEIRDLDRELLVRLLRSGTVTMLDAEAKVTLRGPDDKQLGHGTITPLPVEPGPRQVYRFRTVAHHADGAGQTAPGAAMPGLSFHSRESQMQLTVAVDGVDAIAVPLRAADLQSERPVVVVFVPPAR